MAAFEEEGHGFLFDECRGIGFKDLLGLDEGLLKCRGQDDVADANGTVKGA